MKIIFATNNCHKVVEVKNILKNIEVYSMKYLGIDILIEETGKTFKENAYIKAKALKEYLEKEKLLKDYIVISDDSGLCINYLKGAPGIYSNRFLNDLSNEDRNKKVIEMLKDAKDIERNAYFNSTICCYNKEYIFFEGILEGKISYEIKGKNGFGYDPIFFVEEKNMTLAEMSLEEKNIISHRYKSLSKLKQYLDSL